MNVATRAFPRSEFLPPMCCTFWNVLVDEAGTGASRSLCVECLNKFLFLEIASIDCSFGLLR